MTLSRFYTSWKRGKVQKHPKRACIHDHDQQRIFLNLAFQLYLLQDTHKSVYPWVQNQNLDKAKTYACKIRSSQRWFWKTKETNPILLVSHESIHHLAPPLSSIIHILKGVSTSIWSWQGKDIFMTWVGAGGRRNEEVCKERIWSMHPNPIRATDPMKLKKLSFDWPITI